MSTVFSPTPASVGLDVSGQAGPAVRTRRKSAGIRGLAALLLAAVVSAMVVVADRMISTWADGHLFLAWVMLWVVVFAGLAFFAGSARQLAIRVLHWLDEWSRALAEARAEARLWDLARRDPRMMDELLQARMRAGDSFDEALAPLGHETAGSLSANRWGRFPEQLGTSRERSIHLHYL